MAERTSSRQIPVSLKIPYKTQRSCSIDNSLERGPICRMAPIYTRERKVSISSTNDTALPLCSTPSVAALRKRFENPEAAERPSLFHQTSSFVSTSPINSSTVQVKRIEKTATTDDKLIKVPTQTCVLPELSNGTGGLYNSHSVYNTTDSNDPKTHDEDMSSIPSDDSSQCSSSVTGEYIKSQSDYKINSVPKGSTISSDTTLTTGEDSFDASFPDGEKKVLEITQRINLSNCLKEVYTTEENYVKILYVLSIKLPKEVKKTCRKDENLLRIFHNIYQPLLTSIHRIYTFHHAAILPQIEEYVYKGRKGNIWTLLNENFRIIEPLYKTYYVAYDESQRKLQALGKTHALLDKAMFNIQIHLNNLNPVTQFNCPNQRLLRYILLMKAYTTHLDPTSPEYEHTDFIREELSRIGLRCEEELVISSTQFNDLKTRFDNEPECFKNQQLLWHGLLKKQSPRKHANIARRYIILLTDCILVCSESGRKLYINRELPIKDITTDIVKNERVSSGIFYSASEQQLTAPIQYAFHVNAKEKSYEFLVDKESDREKWVTKIRQANEAFQKRTPTVEIRTTDNHPYVQKLGTRAPAWVNDNDVTRCQNCHNRFRSNALYSRYHHCRSCGHCVCSSCSSNKLILEYCKSKGEVRVCDQCNTYFTGRIIARNRNSYPQITRDPNNTILFGDFRFASSNSTIWIALEEDNHLHIYGGKLDQKEDFSINLPDLRDLSYIRETRTFTLNETNKTYTFSIEFNHQIEFQKTDSINNDIKRSNNKLLFYADLWHETMQSARDRIVPSWYTRKRDSADSGISAIE